MRVLLDTGLLLNEDSFPAVSSDGLLVSLLRHEYLDVYRLQVRSGSPTSGARPPAGDVWLLPRGDGQSAPVLRSDQRGTAWSGVGGNAHDVARHDVASSHYPEMDPAARAERRAADMLAAGAAEAIDADLFVTRRRYLLDSPRPAVRATTVITPEDALGLVSLYLRAQGEATIVIAPGGMRITATRRAFMREGAVALTPHASAWAVPFNQHAHALGLEDIEGLAPSLFERVARTLRARDDLHVTLNATGGKDIAEPLDHLDSFLLSLGAAFDVAARVAHHTLGLPGRQRDAGFRRVGWLKQLRRADQALGALVASESEGARTLAVLSALRNTIHESAFRRVGVGFQSTTAHERVHLTPTLYRELFDAVQHLGGEEAWGLEPLGSGLFQTAHPDRLVEALLPRSLVLLDSIVALTRTDSLPGVDMHSVATYLAARQEPGEARDRESVRVQLSVG